MSLTSTNRHNACAICEDTSGKCRQGREDESYWQCMNHAGAKKGEIVSGFKCIGRTKNGQWAEFKPDNSQNWTQQQRFEWQQENQQRRLQQKRRQQQQIASQLSAADRHKYYSEILDQLSLREPERADLERRGFTPLQIEADSYRSVEQWQEVLGSFASNLPGVLANGKLNSQPGCIFPIKNVDGLIVALSIRLRDGENGRYRWLTSATKKSPEGATPHLDGELPIAVFEPTEYRGDAIWLPEGVGIKPSLTRYRLGVPVVGASSGLLSSSPNTCKATLERLSAKYQTQKLVIPVDGGDVKNTHVCQRWIREFEFLRSLGYEIQIAWWGQINKCDFDIDELDNLSKIKLIALEEFWRWVGNQNLNNSRNNSNIQTGLDQQTTCNVESSTVGLGTKDLELRENGYLLPSGQKEIGLVRQLETLSKSESLTDTNSIQSQITEPVDSLLPPKVCSDIPEWRGKEWDKWRAWRSLTGSIQINSRYVDAELPQDGVVLAVKSGTGSGKTTVLKKLVDEWRNQDSSASFLCPGYRNSLLRQMAHILGIQHIHEKDIRIMSREPGSGIAFCIQSLIKMAAMQEESFANKIVFLDEIMSTLRDLLTGKTVKKRTKVIELFKQMCNEARAIVIMDATLADWGVNLIKSFAPDKQVIVFENTYKGDKGKLNFLLGTMTEEVDKIKKNDRSPYLELALEAFRPLLSSDSQIFLEALDRLLTGMGKKVMRVDSKTIGNPEVKKFLEDSNACVLEYKPQALLYSPSAESGLDISTKGYFSHHFGFFFGVLGVDAIIQMMGRLRDPDCEKYVWIKEHGNIGENAVTKSFKDLILNDINSSLNNEESLQVIHERLHQLIEGSGGIEIDTANMINEMANFEKANLRACAREAFVDAGYKITDRTLKSFEKRSEQEKQVKEEIKIETSELIFKAEQIPVDREDDWKELENLKMSENLNDRWKLDNAFLRKRLPGIEQTEAWTPELVYLTKFKDRAFINHAEMYWLLQNPDIAKSQTARKFCDLSEQDKIFLPDYQNRWTKIHALQEMGIQKFITEGAELHENSPDVKALVSLAPRYENTLGVRLSKQKGCNIKYVSRLLGELGIKLKATQKRIAGERTRIYQIDSESLNNSLRLATLNCIDTKWGGAERAKSELEIAQNSALANLDEKQPQTESANSFEGVTLKTNNVYTKVIQCDSKEEGKAKENLGDLTSGNVAIDSSLGSELEQLVDVLPFVDDAETFAVVIEGSSVDVVEDAIAMTDSQPRRNQLLKWLEASLSASNKVKIESTWTERIKGYGQLLVECFECGVEVIRELLEPWTAEERWAAIGEFKAIAPQKMAELARIEPIWFEWCDET